MQVIIEKAYQGNKDHIRAALDLFVDFMAIFVRSSLTNIVLVTACCFDGSGLHLSTGKDVITVSLLLLEKHWAEASVFAMLQVRLLVILLQNAEKKEERRERKRR